jgi:hypothetical protein
MTLLDLRALHQKIVLVKSACDRRNPPTAMRGTLEVHEDPADRGPLVQIVLQFPQMFTTRAHQRVITLDAAAIERLLAAERNGTFEITLAEPLDPAAPPGNE